MRAARWVLVPVVAIAFVGCGEKVQTMPVGGERKADSQVWQTQNDRFLAPGWTPGDERSWDAQMKSRAQAQNDYAPR